MKLESVDYDPFSGPQLIPVDHDPWSFRRSENIEDRRKEHFLSLPQSPQKPNVFGDSTFGYDMGMKNLDPTEDFAPVPARNALSLALGSGELDKMRRDYLAERGNQLIPVDHDPFAPIVPPDVQVQ